MLVIKAATVGTPQQPVVPANQIATIEGGAVKYPQGTSGALMLPSAAGIMSYFQFWLVVNSLNPGIWCSVTASFATSQALTNASTQEWVGNPQSGHNVGQNPVDE